MSLLFAIVLSFTVQAKPKADVIVINTFEMNQNVRYEIKSLKNKTLLTQISPHKTRTSRLPAKDFQRIERFITENKPDGATKCFNHATVQSKSVTYDVCLSQKDSATQNWRGALRGLASITRLKQKLKK